MDFITVSVTLFVAVIVFDAWSILRLKRQVDTLYVDKDMRV